MHVVLDTSIFRHDPQMRKGAFQAITTLAVNKQLTLHIPNVVRGEFLSYKRKACESHLMAIEGASKKLLALGIKNEEIEKLYTSFSHMKESILQLSQQDFEQWLKTTGAISHPILPEHADLVFDLYFSGVPPFKSLKSREDIPDAFIYQAIVSISRENNTVVVCNDKNLRNVCEKLPNVTVYTSLAEFVAGEPCQTLLKEQVLEDHFGEILSGLEDFKGEIEIELESLLLKELAWKSFNDEVIPSDDNEATIQGVGEPSNVLISYEQIGYCGEGVFTIPFGCNLDLTVYYFVYKGDIFLDESRFEFVSLSDHNDHYYEAEEGLEVTVNGVVTIKIKLAGLDPGDLENTLSIESIELESADVTGVAG